MTRDDTLAVVQRLLAAAWRRDPAGLLDVYAEDAVAISPVLGEVPGRTAIVASGQMLFTTFTDVAVDVSNALVDGDRVAILSSLVTTDRIGLFGRPTDTTIGYRLLLLFTVRDGRIVRDERIYDS